MFLGTTATQIFLKLPFPKFKKKEKKKAYWPDFSKEKNSFVLRAVPNPPAALGQAADLQGFRPPPPPGAKALGQRPDRNQEKGGVASLPRAPPAPVGSEPPCPELAPPPARPVRRRERRPCESDPFYKWHCVRKNRDAGVITFSLVDITLS